MTRRVAIIGAAHRLPEIDGETFWESLSNGSDLVTEVAPDRWDHDLYRHPDRQHPGTSVTFAAGSLGDISGFDASFFGISPREAMHMDPQQRLLLELAWEATEHAGVPAPQLRGSRCGVYVGLSSLDYAYRHADDLAVLDSPSATGNTSSIAANRISYVFDLKGPSMAIDTACSSSLVAFHQACQAIRAGECDTALTGGISLHLHPFGFIVFTKASMLSANGRCRVFDESGDGYARSEGAGLFMLKDYDQALADGNRILAVVAGTAVNTDGHKSGLTVPNSNAQIELLRQAYADADISIDAIDYLEAHGTGTAVGDPIETYAIGEALGKQRSRPLPIGSVKSNIGHLETASGVAGLCKALYSLMHREVPATIGISRVNPRIKTDEWNLDIVTEARKLPEQGPLTVGINSFGFGGVNAHVILQSPPLPAESSPLEAAAAADSDTTATPPHSLPLRLSAHCQQGLRAQAERLANRLEQGDEPLYDIAYALETTRAPLKHGAVVFSTDRDQASQALRAFAKGSKGKDSKGKDSKGKVNVATANYLPDASGPAFIYSGNGCQWETMGSALLDHCPVFSATIDQIDELFRQQSDFSLRAELLGENGSERLARTEIAQPTLFALQVAMTQSLRSWGITPSAVAGHSVGEVAAAWACGALTLEDAVTVITQRSHFQGLTKGLGVMTAVVLDADSTRQWLDDPRFADIALAGDNSVRGVTLAGPEPSIELLEECLSEQQVACFRLPLDYAFHSSAMEPLEKDILSVLANISPRTPQIPFYSTVTGDLADSLPLDARYWWDNIRQPVRFTETMAHLLASGCNVLVEIGAHPILKRYIQDAQRDQEQTGTVITSLQREGDNVQDFQQCLGQLWLSGIAVDHSKVFPVAGRFAELPPYAWQRQSFWIPTSQHSWGLLDRHLEHPLLGYRMRVLEACWQNQLDIQRLPWLADHVVGNAPIFPGAGYVEMAIAAAIHQHDSPVVEIESLEILAPLMLDGPHGRQTRLILDQHQGHIRIESRDTQEGGEWHANARARLLSESLGTQLQRSAPVIPERAADISREQHFALASRIGLDYGPAFQALEGTWRDGDTIIGRLSATERPEDKLQHLSPGRLDSAFQLFLPLLADSLVAEAGFAFVPVRVDRLQLRTTAGLPVLAVASMRKRSPHSFTADFSLFDADGQCVAHLAATRFRLVRLKQTRKDSLSQVQNVLVPAPHPQAEPLQILDGFDAAITQLGKVVAQATQSRYGEELGPLLDRLSDAFARQALTELGHGPRLEREALDAWLSRHPGSAPQWHQLMAQLEGAGSLIADDDGWSFADDDNVSTSDIWQLLIGEYPEALPLIQRVGRHGLHLTELLQDRCDAQAVGLSRERLTALVAYTLSDQGWAALGQHLRTALHTQIDNLPQGQRLAVIEAGIAAPRISEWLSDCVDADHLDLTLLPGDEDGLQRATRLKEQQPLIQVVRPGSEALVETRAQLAILSLSPVSRTAARQQLTQLTELLQPGARLLVLYSPLSHWWDSLCSTPGTGLEHEDSCETQDVEQLLSRYSQNVQRMPLEQGEQGMQLYTLQLESLGSVVQEDSTSLDAPRSDQSESGADSHYLLIHCDAPNAQPHLAALQSSLAALQSSLAARGLSAEQISADALESLDLAAIAPDSQRLHLVDLTLLDSSSDEIERCTRLAGWVARLEGLERQHRLWVMTGSVASMFQASDDGAAAVLPSADSASWGFMRSMANELPHSHITLVDTPIDAFANTQANTPVNSTENVDSEWPAALLDAVTTELQHPTSETELIYDTAGRRFAVRLREAQQQDATSPGQSGDGVSAMTRQLAVSLPGQLRHLEWRDVPLADLDSDSVQVDVQATGLNFRDVMYTLGLLSDEAIEDGFAGASLGLEFAGIVKQVGNNVSDLQPGDHVVGFGPSSFSDQVIAPRTAVTRLPEGVGLAAAATIPTTFFTVYYALKHLAQLQPGERVLIHGAAGGVGIAAIQVARWLGASVLATVGSEEKADFLRLYGVEHIYHSRHLTFAEEILNDTDGQGVDVVLNSLAGEAIAQNLRVLAPFGRFLELGKRDFYENTPMGLRPFRHNLSYFGIDSDQIMKARPELTTRLFREMMALFEDGTLHPLPYSAFAQHRVVEAFRHMQQARQIGKLVVTRGTPDAPAPVTSASLTPAPNEPLALERDGTYLVTGGLSGFGLRTAEWLAERGAGHLLLLGRRGPSTDEACTAIERLQQSGCQVTALACDITDRAALADALALCGTSLPTLRGVVHAATVIDDGLIRHLDRERIERVLVPKIQGARNLHELTQHQPLDLFVLYSSATTLFGNPGQASYVAANCWLEGLAASRRQQGLPATCVCWGAIEDVGFLARNPRTLEALQERLGGAALTSSEALVVLERLILSGESLSAVLSLDWHSLARFLPTDQSPRFRELAAQAGESHERQEHSSELLAELMALPAEDMHKTLVSVLRDELATILLIDPEQIDAQQSVYELGFDSLMGVELMTAIDSRLNIQLPVMVMSEATSLDKLAQVLVRKLTQEGGGEEDDSLLALASAHGSKEAITGLSEESTS
ncbi:type I polyketide synthase [Halomonas huangheensis]|uniref:Uncharacterized protein n=1 Tax=Halomonas huangheensis TaxID=1178482 RepID=W1NBS3_9GAMM|nr:type I polyketide synthase [Halomonas huangheensis]ALM53729.1 hypothetical protein AR456_16700 [Halomonas huangheensis]ERL52355.1 hypothetical protein BJB45_10335 [Halomonas huangheensis]